jgi:hypothetical protein
MIVKIIGARYKGQKQQEWGEKRRRGLTLTRIMLHHHKIFREPRPKRKRNGKNRGRTEQDRTPPLFCPSWDRILRGIRNRDTPF